MLSPDLPLGDLDDCTKNYLQNLADERAKPPSDLSHRESHIAISHFLQCTAGLWRRMEGGPMSIRKRVWVAAITAAMLSSSVLVFLSQNASANAVTWTTDVDFLPGNFFKGMGFETVLHGTGAEAHVQNKEDLISWFEKSPASNPGPRSDFAFANDSLEGRVILFGGLDGNSQWRNDTWEYDIASDNWVQICNDDICPPPRRAYQSMAYDGGGQVAVMYGGLSETGMILTDTWEYDVTTNTWENWTLALRPHDLTAHSMVYDAVDQRMILVGRGATSTEVWVYQQTTHTWTNMSTIGGPSRRSGFSLGYSYQPDHQRVVLFGGAEVMTLYNETWEYNYASNSWSQINTTTNPSARTGASMTYNFQPSIWGLTLFGGSSWSMETWRYNWTGGAADWYQLMLVSNPAPGRKNHGLVYDPGHDKIVLYGGTGSTGTRRNDTWVLENGYRLEGRYYSKFFNTYFTGTPWQYIFWNQTPANVPPNSIIRFQLETNNICDDMALPEWRGPDGTPDTYYTVPGEAIWEGASPAKCIRFLADLITFDSSVTPELQDVTIIYEWMNPPLPKVMSMSPTGSGVPLDAPILINFTTPMNPANVFVSVNPNVSYEPPIWSESDSKVKFNHNAQLFLESARYDVCVWGTDKLGRPLDYPTGKYCWYFTTKLVQPVILATNPTPNSINNPLNAPIIITFSEPMNTSTCWPYVAIDPFILFDGHSWSAGDTVLTMTHSVPFTQFTTYTVDIPVNDPGRPCLDKTGNSLGHGPAPNPWSFTTIAINPYITMTDPMDLETEVPITMPIKATFSRDMDPLAFFFVFKGRGPAPDSQWQNWTGAFTVTWIGRTVSLSHTNAFTSCKPYRVQIWALDTSGRALISNPNVPNPWYFMTGSNCPPFIIHTSPYDGEQNVPTWKNVTIAWYYTPPDTGGMDPASFTFSIRDEWGNEHASEFTAEWLGMGPSAVELRHPAYPLTPCLEYTVKVIAAKDKSGRDFIPGPAENPFKFRIDSSSCPPTILWTQPADGAYNVPLDQPIKIKFSNPMDPVSTFVSIRPSIMTDPMTWTENYTNLTISHLMFNECTVYEITVSGRDQQGVSLVPGPVPNPWSFTTAGACAVILSTDPPDGAVNVPFDKPMTVVFSDSINASSLLVNIVPFIPLAQTWYDNNHRVVLTHANPFAPATTYTVEVSARTMGGIPIGPGPVPNPWHFSTGCSCSVQGLGVHRLPPMDVILDWTASPGAAYYKVFHATDRFAPWPWTGIANVTSTMVVIPNHLADTGCHFYVVRGYFSGQEGSNSSMGVLCHLQVTPTAGKSNTFWFSLPYRTIYKKASDIIDELTSAKVNVVAKWDSAKQKSMIYYYFRGRWRGENFDIFTGDGLWLGIVSAFSWAVNGTDTSHALQFKANPSMRQNYNFISLPYTNAYPNAISISNELSSSKIVEVGRWDPVTQSWQKWIWTGGMWAGINFAILPGDGIYLLIVNSFAWQPRLITPEIP